MPHTFYTRFAKPALDRTLAAAGLVVLAPVMGGVALAVARKLGRPVLFRQTRPGLNGEPFEMVKFRTMTDARGADGALLSDAERLPPFGQFLRSTSLDELPELWNVLRGEMSLVGPRAYLPRELDDMRGKTWPILRVRPGITGLWQVSGRSTVPFEGRLDFDVRYVRDWSFSLDLYLLARTIPAVLTSHGAS